MFRKYSAVLILSISALILSSCKTTDQQIQQWVEKNPDKILKVIMDHQRKQQQANMPKAEDVKANSAALFDVLTPSFAAASQHSRRYQ